jgi:cytochrome c553
MNNGMKLSVLGGLALLSCTLAQAQQHAEGSAAYAIFNCGHCHGEDARTPSKAGVPKIAGLDRQYLAEKTGKLVASMSHKDVIAGCAELPTKAQIQAIADWVSRQPN